MKRLIGLTVAGIIAIFASYAWAASGTLTYNITSGPTPPPPAAAAGFTAAAVNADFSQAQYTNLANWLYQCGGPALPGWSWTVQYNPNTGAPCANIDLENDPSIGKQVLHLNQPVPNGPISVLAYPYPIIFSNNNAFPVTMYFQFTFRFASAGLTQGNSYPNIAGAEFTVGPNHSHWIEPDIFELQPNTNTGSGWIYGDGSTEYACGGGSGFCNAITDPPSVNARADVTVYHTLGILFTSDGISQYWKCNYLDGSGYGCNQLPLSFASIDFAVHDETLGLGIGYGNGVQLTAPVDLYIQNIQVWVCPGSFETSNQCFGTVINH
jgi:hypothetical protein